MNEAQELALAHIRATTETLAAVTEQRYRAVESAQVAGCSNRAIAKAAGISERGIYKLFERRAAAKVE